jgi:hypothetical protein
VGGDAGELLELSVRPLEIAQLCPGLGEVGNPVADGGAGNAAVDREVD